MTTNPLEALVQTGKIMPLHGFAKELYKIFSELNIDPIVYGGLAYHYHTKDSSLPISDIDFLVPEKNFGAIQESLDKLHDVSYKIMPYHSIEVYKGKSRIEIDSSEHFLGSRSQQSDLAKFGDLSLRILNLKSLINIYQEALRNMPFDPKLDEKRRKYNLKLARLEESTATK